MHACARAYLLLHVGIHICVHAFLEYMHAYMHSCSYVQVMNSKLVPAAWHGMACAHGHMKVFMLIAHCSISDVWSDQTHV